MPFWWPCIICSSHDDLLASKISSRASETGNWHNTKSGQRRQQTDLGRGRSHALGNLLQLRFSQAQIVTQA